MTGSQSSREAKGRCAGPSYRLPSLRSFASQDRCTREVKPRPRSEAGRGCQGFAVKGPAQRQGHTAAGGQASCDLSGSGDAVKVIYAEMQTCRFDRQGFPKFPPFSLLLSLRHRLAVATVCSVPFNRAMGLAV